MDSSIRARSLEQGGLAPLLIALDLCAERAVIIEDGDHEIYHIFTV